MRDKSDDELQAIVSASGGPPLHVMLGYASDADIPDDVLESIIDR